MGLYDTVIHFSKKIYIQIKSTECIMKGYEIGDQIPLPDGVHIGYEGAFVVDDGKVLGIYEEIYDKWGGPLDASEIISPANPVGIAIKNIDEHKDS